MAAELLATIGRWRLDRVRVRVEAASVSGQAGLDRVQQVVHLRRRQVAIQRVAQRVDGAVGAGHEVEGGLAGLDRCLVADVAARGGTRVAPGAVQPLAAHEADAGIRERRGQPRDRVGREQRVRVGEHEHLAARLGHATVEGGRLAGAFLAHQTHAVVGVALHARVRVVGRAVGDHDDLELVARVALARERAVELRRDAVALVVRRDDHRDAGRPAPRRHRGPPEREQAQQQRIAEPRVGEQRGHGPEHDRECGHAATRCGSTPAVSR